MSQSMSCPRCGERFAVPENDYATEMTCPMCGAGISRPSRDYSVDPSASFDFQVDEESVRRLREKKTAGKTLWPMIGMTAISGLAVYAGLQQCVLVMLGRANGMVDPSHADAAGLARNWGLAVTTFGLTVVAAIVLVGAICLHNRRFYYVALTGCILASIPCLSPGVLIAIPFGIWGLSVLDKGEFKNTLR